MIQNNCLEYFIPKPTKGLYTKYQLRKTFNETVFDYLIYTSGNVPGYLDKTRLQHGRLEMVRLSPRRNGHRCILNT